MSVLPLQQHPSGRPTVSPNWLLFLVACVVIPAAGLAAQTAKPTSTRRADPRVGLAAGVTDAGTAAQHLELVANRPKPPGFFDPASPGNFAYANSDLAFRGNFVFQGGYNGFQVWDVSNPANPTLRASLVCPGGQGDPSVYGNLLFISVEETSGRIDCGKQGVRDTVSAERFRGVRIFDISDIDNPRQVAAVQTCRGSHTHTLVTDPQDDRNIYVYVSGTSVVRRSEELAGCSGKPPELDPNTSLFQIEVIRVPLASPEDAKVVSAPRLFADPRGNIAGLWKGGTHGQGTQETAPTNQCHDITVYPELGLGAGACSGNGILIDIRDPENPKRLAEVSDPNFAYWHSATFNNDGTSILFTDEWGGGTSPRCRVTDPPKWGANAIYTLAENELKPASFFKIKAAQTDQENCVAHNGSLIPVPGRDIFVQAWYQGGISVIDFTDPKRPIEIASFDRGPVSSEKLVLGGHWSAYWYNGYIYGSEIARGLDVIDLKPSRYLSTNEIEAAKLVRMEQFNPQLQPKLVWPASFLVARAYLDQLERGRGLGRQRIARITRELARAEKLEGLERRDALDVLTSQIEAYLRGSNDSSRVRRLAGAVRSLANDADPRVGLRAGFRDAGEAAFGLRLLANRPKPEGFFDPNDPLASGYSNSDFAFTGNLAFLGNYAGWQVWDVSDPANPKLRKSVICPGHQGDPSVYRNLLFVSIQATSGRLDCGTQGVSDTVSTERFRGVRIYDIRDIDNPKIVASVQTCRGSHTHTLVTDPKDAENVYVYVSGTSVVRSGRELPGCSGRRPEQDANTSLFQIEVIKVPLASPQDAKIVNAPRIFADAGGNVAGLAKQGYHGPGTQFTAETNMCHDITVYPELGLGAGACSGNGILLDIGDPANPKRLTEVSDPNFAYWHSATFNNDGTTILFTDEWGGGSAPRCRASDPPEWGANAIYRLKNRKLTPASFFKLPAPQTDQENCVAHNGSLIPVPGRDIFVQAWYQGGISVIDFTNPERPFEIAYFDRGPADPAKLVDGGHWSAYWYNGYIYGSEKARGLDVLALEPTKHLSRNEIDAANLVRFEQLNVQLQPRIVWPASFVVARAYLDQLVRNKGLASGRTSAAAHDLERAEGLSGAERNIALTRLATRLEGYARSAADPARVRALAKVVRELSRSAQ